MYNILAYSKRYGKKYSKYKKNFHYNEKLSKAQLLDIQKREFKKLVTYAYSNSSFYKKLYNGLDFDFTDINNITKLPMISK